MVINEEPAKATFIECKWQENVNTNTILKQLAKKVESFPWKKDTREDNFVVIAKTFKETKETNEKETIQCYNLKDIEAILKEEKNIK